MNGAIDNVGYLKVPCNWIPTVGNTYSAHFECSDTSIYQGDITLTAVMYGSIPTLTPTAADPGSEWCVQFLENESVAKLWSSWLFGGETISLTITG